MNERKNEIRAAMKARRKALTPEERTAASEIICAKLAADSDIGLRIDPLDGGSPIAVYLASPQEIDIFGWAFSECMGKSALFFYASNGCLQPLSFN